MEYQFPNLPSLFTLISFFMFLILKITKRTKANGSPNLPPGPFKLPLIGNLHNLATSLPHRALRDLAAKHGPVMHLQLGELSVAVVSAPETAELVMKTHDAIFAQRPRVLAAHILAYESKDVAFSNGHYWRQLRKICATELFSAKRVKSFRSIRQEEVAKLVESIRGESFVNLSERIYSLTYGIAGRAAFGAKCKQQERFIACAEETTKMTGGFDVVDVFPSVGWLHVIGGTKGKIERLFGRLDGILETIISERKAGRREAGGIQADNLIDVLLNLLERGGLEFPFTIESVKAVILDIFIAGGETSSAVVEWAMSEMIKNPKIMDEAQREVRRVFGATGIADEAGLEKLTFLKCVIKETLRLHPSAPLLIPRECQEQCKINGYDIPPKTKVIVNAWAIGRDPRHWPEPETFHPERFLDSAVDYKGTDFEFVPFGAGRRMCPGMAFASPNVELPLANLLYHFDWKMGGGVKNEDLDMTEAFGATVRRSQDLCLIPIPYAP